MTPERHQQILALIDRLSNEARLAKACALDDAARLLAMAVLDLQTKLYAISPGELRSFSRSVSNVVDFKTAAPVDDAKHVEVGERSQNGHMPYIV